MSDHSASDKARLARITARQAGRSALAALLRSPLHHWRLAGAPASQLLFVPQDLRTTDPSFAAELKQGHLGLAGFVAEIGDASPFDVAPPSRAWEDRLNGFVWLRHLRAAREEGGRELARELVRDWIRRNKAPRGPAWEPAIVGRRVISWLQSGTLLLEDAGNRTYERIMRSLELQVQHLSGSWRTAPPGQARLTSLTALVYADLCMAGHDEALAQHQLALAAEIDRQVLPFGGHVSRNSAVLVDLLHDLLPLTQCFSARQSAPPEALTGAIKRMLPWLRAMRLGDGQLGRFHGVGGQAPAALATVLAYGDAAVPTALPPESGYIRLQARGTLLLMDAGPPPPLELSGEAHAGCLAFELSSGPHPVIVNCGAPGPVDQDWRMHARSTAAHSTLALDAASSSRLIEARALERVQGAPGLSGPDKVQAALAQRGGGHEVEASHDGYLSRFGLLHRRSLRLDQGDGRLDGCDRLGPPDKSQRVKGDVTYAIHFHVHPGVSCRMGEQAGTAELELASGERWRILYKGEASLSIEESTWLADLSGPRRTVAIVLRGRCLDSAEVHWRLERIGVGK